ncbi:MAG: ABC transporter substrate-binding protein [Actinomycetota bacterium]
MVYPDEPPSLNPYLFEGDSSATRDLLRPVLPTLLNVRPDMKFAPGLAVKVPAGADVTRNPFRVTYRLDPGAKWSDGRPVTADDVRFTWETIKDSRWPIADRTGYDRLTDVVVAGPKTVRLEFDGSYGPWRNLFSAGDFILPKHALEGKDFSREMIETIPVSGGPYVLESRTPGLELVYRANRSFSSSTVRPARLDMVRVLIAPDTEIALRLVSSGRASALAATTRVNLERRMSAIDLEISTRYGASWWQLFFNQSRSTMQNPSVRQAIVRGFDRSGFAEAFIRSDGRVLNAPAPGRTDSFGRYMADPAAARSLARAVAGRSLTLVSPGGNQIAGLLGVSLQKQLEAAGLELQIVSPDGPDFYRTWRRDGDFDMGIWEQRGVAGMLPSGGYRSTAAAPGGANYSRLKSAAVDTALEAADRELSPGKAAAALDDVLAAELAVLPLLETRSYVAHSPGVSGPAANAGADGPFWNLQDWRLT